MILIQAQNFYERYTGLKHSIAILFTRRRCYEVRVDDEFYSTAETRGQAFDEVADILSITNWSPINPF